MRKLLAIISVFTLALTLSACRDEPLENTVYVTAYPIYYLVEEIGKDIVNTKYVPGSQVHAEHHDWSANEIIDMQDADLLFYVGAGLDPYIDRNLDSVFKDQHVELVRFEDYIDIIKVKLIHDHDHNGHDHNDHDHNDHNHNDHDHDDDDATLMPDPHFWLDVGRMIEAAEIVRDKLIETYPEEEARILNNYFTVEILLEGLHEAYQEELAGEEKPLITNVKLFTYMEKAYGIDIRPFTLHAHAHENEPIPGDFDHFIDLANDYDIRYILFEKNAKSPAGDALLSELQAHNPDTAKLHLHPVGFLTDEELRVNKNYITVMYENLEALKTALE